jgi:adenylyltransferase/sulfurtransferase
VIGSIQVTEAVKYVLGSRELLTDRLVLWDGLNSCMDEVACERDASCRDCSEVFAKES